MRKLRSALCVLGLVALIPLLIRANRLLPVDTRPLVAEKYAGWSGVLRLWLLDGGLGSGASPWLNRCVALYEKSHPGVYIQPRFVDEGAIAAMNGDGIVPPDMILFAPGLLSEPTGLLTLQPAAGLRPALADCGRWNGAIYAVPVAMGGYLWAWNTSRVEAMPDTWLDTDATLSVPTPEHWRRWDAALLALCSGQYSPDGEISPTDISSPGIDLGLGGHDTPAPTAAPPTDDAPRLSRQLPDGFQYDGDAWRHFINGESAAMPVTQREVRRLQALSDQGKGPDWRLSPGDAAFTDQLLCFAIVDRPDAASQQALCAQFLSLLLSDECQGMLSLASAFSVTDAASGYASNDPLSTMEAALADEGLCVPRCFDDEWLLATEEIVRKFILEDSDAPLLWRRLRSVLQNNPNN